MQESEIQTQKAKALLREMFQELEVASRGNLSTDDKSPKRLLWEIFNKIFNILVILENSLQFKDSLSAHLLARYTYELLIIFAYIFLDEDGSQERAEKFLSFNQFLNTERKWTDLDLVSMINAMPDKNRFSLHKEHYRRLCNFAHPSMDSFMLNRRGEDIEQLMILSTVLLTLGTIIEIIKICFEKDLYFTEKSRIMIATGSISEKADALMKELRAQ